MLLELLLIVTTTFVHGSCAPESLLLSANLMTENLCHLYNDSHLDKLNGFVICPNATATFQPFDPITGMCAPFYSLPLNVYFPLVLSVEHECLAVIPAYSNIGENGMVSMSAYADIVVATESKVIDMTIVYTQPFQDCTLRIAEFTMRDVQCVMVSIPTTSTSVLPTAEITGSSPAVTRLTSATTVTSPPVYKDEQRYTQISSAGAGAGAEDSLNNPFLYRDLPVCASTAGRFRVVMSSIDYRMAAVACLRKGMRMARLQREDLGTAVDLITSCAGLSRSAWIGEYWRTPARPDRCLEVVAPSLSGEPGGLSLASSCSKLQPVLCEEVFFNVQAL